LQRRWLAYWLDRNPNYLLIISNDLMGGGALDANEDGFIALYNPQLIIPHDGITTINLGMH
jgi:hypothetical protein